MASLSVTPGNVTPSPGAKRVTALATDTITAGQPFWINPANGEASPASASDDAKFRAAAVAVSSAAVGQPVVGVSRGLISVSDDVEEGVIYVLGDAGEICELGDLSEGDHVTILGVGLESGALDVMIYASAATIPGDD